MASETNEQKPLLTGKRALVIDDMGAAVAIGRNMLMGMGAAQVDTASDYPKAFPLLASKRYDLVLCDFNLGKGLNGQQLLRDVRHIKRLSYTTLFIVVSAERTKDIVLGTIECEPDGYITKPFTLRDFQLRITRLVEQQVEFKAFNEALDKEDYDKAFAIADRLKEQSPKYRMLAIRKHAGMLYELKRFEESLALFNEALATHTQTWAQIGRARCIAELGRTREAMTEFEQIIESNPLAVPAIDSLARCHLREGSKREAQTTIAKSLALSPMSIERQRWFGELSLEIGDIDTAVKAYRAVLDLAEGTLKENPGNHATFTKTLRKAIESATDNKKRQELISEGKANIKAARKRFEDAEQLRLNESLLRALEKFHQGNSEESIAIVDATMERHRELLGQDPEAVIDIAETKFFAGDRPGAEAILRKLMKEYPENSKLMERIQAIIDTPVSYYKRVFITEMNRQGRQYYNDGDFENALKHFRIALREYPAHPAINLNAAQATLKMIEAGTRSNSALLEAKSYLDASVPLEPEHPEFKRMKSFKQYLSRAIR